jgi:hypothetical protein
MEATTRLLQEATHTLPGILTNHDVDSLQERGVDIAGLRQWNHVAQQLSPPTQPISPTTVEIFRQLRPFVKGIQATVAADRRRVWSYVELAVKDVLLLNTPEALLQRSAFTEPPELAGSLGGTERVDGAADSVRIAAGEV